MIDDFLRFEKSAGIVLFRVDRGRRLYLFLKRREGFLDFPKGHIEVGEDPKAAAVRETFEEAGVTASPIPFFSFEEIYWFVRNGERIKKSVVLFLAQVRNSQRVKISKEHVGYIWLDRASALGRIRMASQRKAFIRADRYAERVVGLGRLNGNYKKLPSRFKKWKLSRKFVPGEGPLDARVMLIGQAPGANENKTGRPFIGQSGKLLNQLIVSSGLRREDLYICSVVQFFPPGNRLPKCHEVEACIPFVKRQIELIDPRLVILVGALSSKEIAGVIGIMKAHGQLVTGEDERRYFVTLHPAAAVRLKKNLPLIRGDFLRLAAVIKTLK
jgi:DNA polymerase